MPRDASWHAISCVHQIADAKQRLTSSGKAALLQAALSQLPRPVLHFAPAHEHYWDRVAYELDPRALHKGSAANLSLLLQRLPILNSCGNQSAPSCKQCI